MLLSLYASEKTLLILTCAAERIVFESLHCAKDEFRWTLEKRKIPFFLSFSQSEHSAILQLPGTCLLAATANPKAMNKQQSLLYRLAKQAVEKGCFVIVP